MKKLLLCLSFLVLSFPLQAGTSLIDQLDQLDSESIRLGSISAAVVEIESGEVLYLKNGGSVRPVASITKLMTAMVVLDADQPLDEKLTITRADRDLLKNTYSRVRFGSRLSRRELLLIALMSSENRAASALGRHYPGGKEGFVEAMNAKAASLGMLRTRFVDATGLSPGNVSTAGDLVKMVRAASGYPMISEFTTQADHVARFENPSYSLSYVNSNVLVRRGSWDIALSKTGYINEAGRCLVMLTEVDGRQVAMVMLDSYGKWTPIGDAGRIKRWINTGESGTIAGAALRYEQSKSGQDMQTLAGG
ncbi:D-alanyl-D-alanine endopeptidase [Hydrocarboniclastica marina]|uniref:D-alanyl-D-alanine endopeptidase n=1 Tax=Hydrocarboniclastica marina TaxID=2259620 RepID=A0A4P7XJM0_9ALTE|nr:D-alanyl-D-alanine endopeptidase [Hydrocarboniclastica marina]MAL98219.1 D-alanyl-D-alanine endopeptidase [Alteromonadaceae bacterium]QCF26995.1 D-alanyl-D-alanine endopeptidase [Hydrocarboniclastica marina]